MQRKISLFFLYVASVAYIFEKIKRNLYLVMEKNMEIHILTGLSKAKGF